MQTVSFHKHTVKTVGIFEFICCCLTELYPAVSLKRNSRAIIYLFALCTESVVDLGKTAFCVTLIEVLALGKLLLGSTPIQNASRERVVSIICEAVSKEGLSILNWDDEVSQLQRRLTQAAQWHPEIGFPDLSTEHLLTTPNEWLPYILEQDNKLKTSTEELKKINLAKVLLTLIPYEQQQQLERIAPTHIVVPTGSHIRIDYRQGSDIPVLSVRLQECFGLTDTPRINEGRQPVLMELLSPGFKPVQLTQDLKSFWENTYFEVRKELKRRYPKHYWPENPLEAEAVRGVKKSNS